jgi:hypothetical protein
MMKNNYDNEDNQPNNDSNDDTDTDTNNNVNVDVVSVALEAYTEAIINPESEHFKFAHYINDHAIIYDRFKEIISLLFEMELNPATKSVVMESYVVKYIFSDDNYPFTEYIATSRKGKQRKLGVQNEVLVVLIKPEIIIFEASLIITFSSIQWRVENAPLATRIVTRANALQTYMAILGLCFFHSVMILSNGVHTMAKSST